MRRQCQGARSRAAHSHHRPHGAMAEPGRVPQDRRACAASRQRQVRAVKEATTGWVSSNLAHARRSWPTGSPVSRDAAGWPRLIGDMKALPT